MEKRKEKKKKSQQALNQKELNYTRRLGMECGFSDFNDQKP
jgi:hypothetical protein